MTETIALQKNNTNNNTHPKLELPAVCNEMLMFTVSIRHSQQRAVKRNIGFDLGLQVVQPISGGMKWAVLKENFHIDGMLSQGAVNEINSQIGTLLYPAWLLINKDGRITKVEIDDTLHERWESLKQELTGLYKGNIIDGIIQTTDSIINNIEKLQQVYLYDWLICLLFSGIYDRYDNNARKTITLQLPLDNVSATNQKVQMNVECQMQEHDMEAPNIKILLKGHLDKDWWNTTGQNLWTSSEKYDGDKTSLIQVFLAGRLLIDKETRILSGMKATLILEQDNEIKETTMEISRKT